MDSSRTLPTGVVTFLLTDIEGSTRLWETEPEAMREALTRHDAVVNTCVRRFNGHVVKSKGEGDSVFAVFRHARDAITAALVVQCALGDERWATRSPIRVRMAVHTGQIELRDGDYYGPTVNRCARLRGLARGGQVLVSGVTAQLLQGQLPSGATLKDLGTRQLKDLSAPERVWQLEHPRLPSGAQAASQHSAPAVASVADAERRGYKLTDHMNRSTDGQEWVPGRTYTASGLSLGDDDGAIRCYLSPASAALLNAQFERFRMPRLWEVRMDRDVMPGSAIEACQQVTAVRPVELPLLSGRHHAHFAVLCAVAAYSGGPYEAEFKDWATMWLNGGDNSGVGARELADSLDREANRALGVVVPQHRMLANAARAAAHASKLGFLAGRARDQENTLAIDYAVQTVHTAMRITQLDVVAFADQAVPNAAAAAPVARIRPTASPAASNRILRALPT